MTEAQKFAMQADLNAEDLPLRTDEMTVWSSIVADGTTLTINFDMDEGFGEFHAGLETDNVEEVCAPDMYAEEISDGGRVIYTFHRQDGQAWTRSPLLRLNVSGFSATGTAEVNGQYMRASNRENFVATSVWRA